jgi:prephenate dehydrogenase
LRTVAIVGVGLIGGSIGKTLRARGLADRVVGIGRDAGRLADAQRFGAIDAGTTDLAEGVAGAGVEVVVVCTPVDRVAEDVRRAARAAGPDVLVTDAGSTKAAIVAAAEADPEAARVFVAAHPIAGSERSGAAAARVGLFDGRACAITPTARTPADRLARARAFWEALGSVVYELSPEAHDHALALTSHLPHAAAAALAASVPVGLLPLAAGAYRDGTRVAGADASLWTAIFLANRGPLADALAAYRGELDRFAAALAAGDAAALSAWWDRARAHRQAFAHGRAAPGDAAT